MKCAVEEEAEGTFILTQFINQRFPPQSCWCLSCMSALRWQDYRGRLAPRSENRKGAQEKSTCFKNVSQRSEMPVIWNMHVQYVHAQNPCTDAEIQRLIAFSEMKDGAWNFLWAPEWQQILKGSTKKRVGEGWKGKNEPKSSLGATSFAGISLYLFNWGKKKRKKRIQLVGSQVPLISPCLASLPNEKY